jgi:hypothetical protein
MRHAPALAVAIAGMALLVSPTAQADPTPDAIYSKWLSTYSVNYQGRYTFAEMTQEGQRVCALLGEQANATTLKNAQQTLVNQRGFSTKEANGIIDSAVQSYCHDYSQLVVDSGIMATS